VEPVREEGTDKKDREEKDREEPQDREGRDQDPAPDEEPTPPPEETTARIGFKGADGIRLTSGTGSFGPGDVPPGTYKIRARFGAREVSAGTVRVTAGERITLKCDADFEMCGR
jgi:hypothetical protein